MFSVTTPSRFSQRFTGARARRQALRASRPAQRRASFGESFAVGLGCDTYKRQS